MSRRGLEDLRSRDCERLTKDANKDPILGGAKVTGSLPRDTPLAFMGRGKLRMAI